MRTEKECVVNMTKSKAQITQSRVKVGLFLVYNALTLHEALAKSDVIPHLQRLHQIDQKDPITWLINEWNKILPEKTYRSIFMPTLKLLEHLPANVAVNRAVLSLADLALSTVRSGVIFRHDLAGRVYHYLLFRTLAKGLATYYTSLEAAMLLSELALAESTITFETPHALQNLTVFDLACGSGTLLSAMYSAIVDRFMTQKMVKGIKPTVEERNLLHKMLLEHVLCGFDVMEYAAHLATSTLILRSPNTPVEKTNIYVLPLGIDRQQKKRLGSLDLAVDSHTNKVMVPTTGLLTPLPATAKAVSLTDLKTNILMLQRPDIIIMNPPFARTGNVGKSSLFGHLPQTNRKELLVELKKLGKKWIKERGVARSFGRAGLAAYFLLKAAQLLKPHGVMAFVLPRVVLSGIDWQPIRLYLVDNNILPTAIIISDDPNKNWAWSENTVLSEICLILKHYPPITTTKKEEKTPPTTQVVYVKRAPMSTLEAKVYARYLISFKHLKPWKLQQIRDRKQNLLMNVYTVEEKKVKKAASINWNLITGFSHPLLTHTAYHLYFGKTFNGHALPLIPIKEYLFSSAATTCKQNKSPTKWKKKVGYDVSQLRRKCLAGGNYSVKYLDALNMGTFSRIKIPSPMLKNHTTNEDCYKRSGKLLIGGVARMWLPTIGIIAAYSHERTISQVTWTLPIIDPLEALGQAGWLNSTLGLLHFLSLRQDSKGGYIQLKKENLGDLQLLEPNVAIQLGKTLKNEGLDEVTLGPLNEQLNGNMKTKRELLDHKVITTVLENIDSHILDLLEQIRTFLGEETLFHRYRVK